MPTFVRGLCTDLGLSQRTTFYRDKTFIVAIGAGIAVVVVMRLLLARNAINAPAVNLGTIFNWLLWAPVVEELLFRGVIQGQLYRKWDVSRTFLGLSYANWLTSLAFSAMHFFHHPPLWAIAVLVPSLVFGFFRDRDGSVLPAIALHAIYNAQYLLLFG
jgi:membrane protease YdiL (CAAX protease family)